MFQNHVFLWISASIAEAAAVILTGAKKIFAKGAATFITVPANLLNNEPKNPPDWVILDIWALESFILIDILFSNAFLNFVFCLVVYDNSWGKLFPLNIFIFILKINPVWFLDADFNLFSCEFDNLTFTLLYSTISTIHRTFVVPL